jgi:hypothetical protein
MKNNNFNGIAGTVAAIEVSSEVIKIFFTVGKVIELPLNTFSAEVLDSIIGKRIGICNNNGNYKIRIIKKKFKDKKER